MVHKLSGVIAAVPTPVSAAGAPDAGRFLAHAQWCLEHGCDALNVLGTTGEANSMSSDQRRSVMRSAAQALKGDQLMVGTGVSDLETTIALTREAHDLGYGGALLLPPFYYKGLHDEALFRWFAHVVEATTDIALYLYNFPQMTGITFSPELARRLHESFPDRVAGAKDSSGDLSYAARLALIEGFDVFPSNEAALVRRAEDGYAGVISATANVSAPLAGALNIDPTNEALAEKVAQVRKAISAQPLIPAVKYMVSRIHRDDDFALPLPPHLPLSGEQMAALDQIDISL